MVITITMMMMMMMMMMIAPPCRLTPSSPITLPAQVVSFQAMLSGLNFSEATSVLSLENALVEAFSISVALNASVSVDNIQTQLEGAEGLEFGSRVEFVPVVFFSALGSSATLSDSDVLLEDAFDKALDFALGLVDPDSAEEVEWREFTCRYKI